MRTADELKDIIPHATKAFAAISEESWVAKPHADKWSKQEILGHLIDSASNNIRRLVVSQYEPGQKIVYQQEQWVSLQNYQQTDYRELIELWRLLNLQMVRVMNTIPESKLSHVCDTGKDTLEYRTLAFLMTDYVAHLKHHLTQILE
jgi:hypothetical protein